MGGGASAAREIQGLIEATFLLGQAIASMSFPDMYRIYDFHSKDAPPLKLTSGNGQDNIQFIQIGGDREGSRANRRVIMDRGQESGENSKKNNNDDDDDDDDDDDNNNNNNNNKIDYDLSDKFHLHVNNHDIYLDDINMQNEDGWTPLHSCCHSYSTVKAGEILIDELVKLDEDLNKKTSRGPGKYNAEWTPLHMACAYGIEPLVLKLIENNADVDCENNLSWSPIHEAAHRGFINIVKALVEAGCNTSKIPDMDKCRESPFIRAPPQSPLGEASRCDFPEIVKYLIEEGDVDINQQNELGWTALHEAVFFNHKDIVKYLLENDADPSIRNAQGALPIHLSSIGEVFDILKDIGGAKALPDEEEFKEMEERRNKLVAERKEAERKLKEERKKIMENRNHSGALTIIEIKDGQVRERIVHPNNNLIKENDNNDDKDNDNNNDEIKIEYINDTNNNDNEIEKDDNIIINKNINHIRNNSDNKRKSRRNNLDDSFKIISDTNSIRISTSFPSIPPEKIIENAKENNVNIIEEQEYPFVIFVLWNGVKHKCGNIPLDDELMESWEGDGLFDCKKCGKKYVPHLKYKIILPEKEINDNIDNNINNNDTINILNVKLNSEGEVEFMSPLNLRSLLERLLQQSGEIMLLRERLLEKNLTLLFNLWWHFSRIGLPLPVASGIELLPQKWVLINSWNQEEEFYKELTNKIINLKNKLKDIQINYLKKQRDLMPSKDDNDWIINEYPRNDMEVKSIKESLNNYKFLGRSKGLSTALHLHLHITHCGGTTLHNWITREFPSGKYPEASSMNLNRAYSGLIRRIKEDDPLEKKEEALLTAEAPDLDIGMLEAFFPKEKLPWGSDKVVWSLILRHAFKRMLDRGDIRKNGEPDAASGPNYPLGQLLGRSGDLSGACKTCCGMYETNDAAAINCIGRHETKYTRSDLNYIKDKLRLIPVIVTLEDYHSTEQLFCKILKWTNCKIDSSVHRELSQISIDHTPFKVDFNKLGYDKMSDISFMVDHAQLDLEMYFYARELIRQQAYRLNLDPPDVEFLPNNMYNQIESYRKSLKQ